MHQQIFYEKSGTRVLLQWRTKQALCDNLRTVGIDSKTKAECDRYPALSFSMIDTSAFEKIKTAGVKTNDTHLLQFVENNGGNGHFQTSLETLARLFTTEKPGKFVVAESKKADPVAGLSKRQAGNLLNEKALRLVAIENLPYSRAFEMVRSQNRKLYELYAG